MAHRKQQRRIWPRRVFQQQITQRCARIAVAKLDKLASLQRLVQLLALHGAQGRVHQVFVPVANRWTAVVRGEERGSTGSYRRRAIFVGQDFSA